MSLLNSVILNAVESYHMYLCTHHMYSQQRISPTVESVTRDQDLGKDPGSIPASACERLYTLQEVGKDAQIDG